MQARASGTSPPHRHRRPAAAQRGWRSVVAPCERCRGLLLSQPHPSFIVPLPAWRRRLSGLALIVSSLCLSPLLLLRSSRCLRARPCVRVHTQSHFPALSARAAPSSSTAHGTRPCTVLAVIMCRVRRAVHCTAQCPCLCLYPRLRCYRTGAKQQPSQEWRGRCQCLHRPGALQPLLLLISESGMALDLELRRRARRMCRAGTDALRLQLTQLSGRSCC